MKRIVAIAIGASLAGAALAGPAEAQDRYQRKIEASRQAYLRLFEVEDRRVPERLLEGARCIAVLPNVIKGAFGWGGRRGQGVMSCRNDEGAWSPPAFVKLTGGSFGLQAGGQVTDLVLFFMTEKGARSLLKSKFILGGDATVAAGPVGRAAEASTDAYFNAEIYAYARSRGLFAGLSIEGAQLSVYQDWIRGYYGERIWP
ncbi:MAG: lipid-binding SYLF domain-containing protein, partial [Acidobacteriota bacterium]|nr:lipid-binding SYLF domain-containing protein [Acidobacteriota bacterium]